MITPADIENKEFSRAKKGYKEEEVDEFLDLIIVDMEKLLRENYQLKNDLEKAHSQVDKHMSTETSVYETLEAAKALMNDIAASAERRAEILLKNAELEASLITKEARESISRYTEEGSKIKGRFEMLRDRYKQMLELELERVEFTETAFLEEFEEDFLPASMVSHTDEKKPSSETKVMDKVEEKKEDVDLSKTMVNIR